MQTLFALRSFQVLTSRIPKTAFLMVLSGLLLPLGFAPFEQSGATFISLGLLYMLLNEITVPFQAFSAGILFGCGFFGFGVSWIFVSIHQYGHLDNISSLLLTSGFILFLSSYFGLTFLLYTRLKSTNKSFRNACLFASLMTLCDYLRATLFTGFPWLLFGYTQINTPLKYLFPVIGVFGTGWMICFISALTVQLINKKEKKSWKMIGFYPFLILFPLIFSTVSWTHPISKPISIGIVQENLSMHDKWDETLFWTILKEYKSSIQKLVNMDLILLPESAIPLPYRYVSDYLNKLNKFSKKNHIGLIAGIPIPTSYAEDHFFNAAMTLGDAKGTYVKQHLVPFGEYLPKPFVKLSKMLNIEDPSMTPAKNLTYLTYKHKPMATLLCYEVAYDELLRQQFPNAQWIISLSEDGWFGHSLAIYQHLEMARVRAIQTGRYHIVANNAGLSAIINNEGIIVQKLPAFTSGILTSAIIPMTGETPWVLWGDKPIIAGCFLSIFIISLQLQGQRRKLQQKIL